MSNDFNVNLIPFTFGALTSNSFIKSNSQWNLHWENKWIDTDWPSFLVLSQEGFEIIN